MFLCWCFNAPPVLHILGNQTTFCILDLTRMFLCFWFIRLDYKRLLHMDTGMPDSDQYWHKGSLWWGSYCCCSVILTCLMGEQLFFSHSTSIRAADNDCRTGGMWEIFSFTGCTGRDAKDFWEHHMEQVNPTLMLR